jgi:hypothetical protein
MTLAAAALVVAGSATKTHAGAHSWRVSEAFSNADGTIWFVEIWEYAGGGVERGIGGAFVQSINTGQSIDIENNIPLTEDTAKKFYLFGNQAFADLPGSPPLDQLVAGNAPFSFASGERLRYSISGAAFDLIFPTALPTGGIMSLHLDTTIGTGGAVSSVVNSPTNFAGATGSVDASGGSGGSGDTALLLNKTVGPTVDVILSWGASCEAGDTAFGVYRGTLASLRGGVYDHAAVTCGLAASTTTLAEQAAIAGEYYLVVPASASTEGSYGRSFISGTPAERPTGIGACETQTISCP